MKKRNIQKKAERKRTGSGFTLVEVVVALALISIITITALSTVISSNHVFNDVAARDKARQLADNAISSFIFSDNYEAYQQALGVFVSEDDHEDTREQGAPIVISGGTLKKYNTDNYLFSYVLRDDSAKTLSLCSDAGAVIASLSYDSDSALKTAADGNSRLSRVDLSAVLSNMKYNATNMTNGTLKVTTDPNAPGKYNIVLKLDILPVVTSALIGYSISQELPDITLYYNSTDGKFYRKDSGSFISYTFDGYYRLIVGTYPGFEEDTGVSSLPEGCRYEKGQCSEILQKCIDLIKDNLNGGSIGFPEGPARYECSGNRHYAGIALDWSAKQEQLIDETGTPIIYKTLSESDFIGEVKAYNGNDAMTEDGSNVYRYTYTGSASYERSENVPDIRSMTYSAVLVKSGSSWKLTLTDSEGRKLIDNETVTGSNIKTAASTKIKNTLTENGGTGINIPGPVESDWEYSYSASKRSVTGSGSGSLDVTVGTNSITCKSSYTTYYYNYTKSFWGSDTHEWSRTKKTYDSPEELDAALQDAISNGGVSSVKGNVIAYTYSDITCNMNRYTSTDHTVVISGSGYSWKVTVDGEELPDTYRSEDAAITALTGMYTNGAKAPEFSDRSSENQYSTENHTATLEKYTKQFSFNTYWRLKIDGNSVDEDSSVTDAPGDIRDHLLGKGFTEVTVPDPAVTGYESITGKTSKKKITGGRYDSDNNNITVSVSVSSPYSITANSSGTYYYDSGSHTWTKTNKTYGSLDDLAAALEDAKAKGKITSLSYTPKEYLYKDIVCKKKTGEVITCKMTEYRQAYTDKTLSVTYSVPVTVTASYADKTIRREIDQSGISPSAIVFGGKTVDASTVTLPAISEILDSITGQVIGSNGTTSYSDAAQFAAAQRALFTTSGYSFVPAGVYRYVQVHFLDSVTVRYLEYMEEGGILCFNGDNGVPLYELTIYTDEKLNEAITLLKTTYAGFYNYQCIYHFDGSKGSSIDALNGEKFDYVFNDTDKTIQRTDTGKYLRYRYGNYSWYSYSTGLGENYEAAKEYLNAGTAKEEIFRYRSTPGRLSIVIDENYLVSFYVDYSADAGNEPVFRWQCSLAEINASGNYFDNHDTYEEVEGTISSFEECGTYVCRVDDYTVEITVNFTQKVFDAYVRDSNDSVIYELHYEKG